MNNKFLNALLKTQHLKNSLYAILKHNFLYHSNKIEGSTFTTEALALLLDKNVVTAVATINAITHGLIPLKNALTPLYFNKLLINDAISKITIKEVKTTPNVAKNAPNNTP